MKRSKSPLTFQENRDVTTQKAIVLQNCVLLHRGVKIGTVRTHILVAHRAHDLRTLLELHDGGSVWHLEEVPWILVHS
jgi:hypothetical protein